MKNLLLMSLLSVSLIACDRPNHPTDSSSTVQDVDNTGINVRDRDSSALTPMDQSGSEADRTITQDIRQSIMSASGLSLNAKNIKIITIDGTVTLRGPVANAREREIIVQIVREVPGVLNLENQLEVSQSH